jgi:hypothetical protein
VVGLIAASLAEHLAVGGIAFLVGLFAFGGSAR